MALCFLGEGDGLGEKLVSLRRRRDLVVEKGQHVGERRGERARAECCAVEGDRGRGDTLIGCIGLVRVALCQLGHVSAVVPDLGRTHLERRQHLIAGDLGPLLVTVQPLRRRRAAGGGEGVRHQRTQQRKALVAVVPVETGNVGRRKVPEEVAGLPEGVVAPHRVLAARPIRIAGAVRGKMPEEDRRVRALVIKLHAGRRRLEIGVSPLTKTPVRRETWVWP